MPFKTSLFINLFIKPEILYENIGKTKLRFLNPKGCHVVGKNNT
jgi:hypothetical protein